VLRRWVVTVSAAVVALTGCTHESSRPVDAQGTHECASGFKAEQVALVNGLGWAIEDRAGSNGIVFPVALCLYDAAEPTTAGGSTT